MSSISVSTKLQHRVNSSNKNSSCDHQHRWNPLRSAPAWLMDSVLAVTDPFALLPEPPSDDFLATALAHVRASDAENVGGHNPLPIRPKTARPMMGAYFDHQHQQSSRLSQSARLSPPPPQPHRQRQQAAATTSSAAFSRDQYYDQIPAAHNNAPTASSSQRPSTSPSCNSLRYNHHHHDHRHQQTQQEQQQQQQLPRPKVGRSLLQPTLATLISTRHSLLARLKTMQGSAEMTLIGGGGSLHHNVRVNEQLRSIVDKLEIIQMQIDQLSRDNIIPNDVATAGSINNITNRHHHQHQRQQQQQQLKRSSSIFSPDWGDQQQHPPSYGAAAAITTSPIRLQRQQPCATSLPSTSSPYSLARETIATPARETTAVMMSTTHHQPQPQQQQQQQLQQQFLLSFESLLLLEETEHLLRAKLEKQEKSSRFVLATLRSQELKSLREEELEREAQELLHEQQQQQQRREARHTRLVLADLERRESEQEESERRRRTRDEQLERERERERRRREEEDEQAALLQRERLVREERDCRVWNEDDERSRRRDAERASRQEEEALRRDADERIRTAREQQQREAEETRRRWSLLHQRLEREEDDLRDELISSELEERKRRRERYHQEREEALDRAEQKMIVERQTRREEHERQEREQQEQRRREVQIREEQAENEQRRLRREQTRLYFDHVLQQTQSDEERCRFGINQSEDAEVGALLTGERTRRKRIAAEIDERNAIDAQRQQLQHEQQQFKQRQDRLAVEHREDEVRRWEIESGEDQGWRRILCDEGDQRNIAVEQQLRQQQSEADAEAAAVQKKQRQQQQQQQQQERDNSVEKHFAASKLNSVVTSEIDTLVHQFVDDQQQQWTLAVKEQQQQLHQRRALVVINEEEACARSDVESSRNGEFCELKERAEENHRGALSITTEREKQQNEEERLRQQRRQQQEHEENEKEKQKQEQLQLRQQQREDRVALEREEDDERVGDIEFDAHSDWNDIVDSEDKSRSEAKSREQNRLRREQQQQQEANEQEAAQERQRQQKEQARVAAAADRRARVQGATSLVTLTDDFIMIHLVNAFLRDQVHAKEQQQKQQQKQQQQQREQNFAAATKLLGDDEEAARYQIQDDEDELFQNLSCGQQNDHDEIVAALAAAQKRRQQQQAEEEEKERQDAKRKLEQEEQALEARRCVECDEQDGRIDEVESTETNDWIQLFDLEAEQRSEAKTREEDRVRRENLRQVEQERQQIEKQIQQQQQQQQQRAAENEQVAAEAEERRRRQQQLQQRHLENQKYIEEAKKLKIEGATSVSSVVDSLLDRFADEFISSLRLLEEEQQEKLKDEARQAQAVAAAEAENYYRRHHQRQQQERAFAIQREEVESSESDDRTDIQTDWIAACQEEFEGISSKNLAHAHEQNEQRKRQEGAVSPVDKQHQSLEQPRLLLTSLLPSTAPSSLKFSSVSLLNQTLNESLQSWISDASSKLLESQQEDDERQHVQQEQQGHVEHPHTHSSEEQQQQQQQQQQQRLSLRQEQEQEQDYAKSFSTLVHGVASIFFEKGSFSGGSGGEQRQQTLAGKKQALHNLLDEFRSRQWGEVAQDNRIAKQRQETAYASHTPSGLTSSDLRFNANYEPPLCGLLADDDDASHHLAVDCLSELYLKRAKLSVSSASPFSPMSEQQQKRLFETDVASVLSQVATGYAVRSPGVEDALLLLLATSAGGPPKPVNSNANSNDGRNSLQLQHSHRGVIESLVAGTWHASPAVETSAAPAAPTTNTSAVAPVGSANSLVLDRVVNLLLDETLDDTLRWVTNSLLLPLH